MNLSRLIRILNCFWFSSIEIELEYRFNFIIEFLSVFGSLIGSLFTLSLFYNLDTNLGGWSWEASIVVLGIYTLLEGFTITFLQPNLSRIVKHVQHGTLDFILLKPIDSQLWISFRIFSPWGIPSIIAGLILIFYGSYISHIEITLNRIIFSSMMLMSSLVILYTFLNTLVTPSLANQILEEKNKKLINLEDIENIINSNSDELKII